MLHDILIILVNLAAFVAALALLMLTPYIIIFLLFMIPGVMLSCIPCLLAEALFAHTSLHDRVMAVVGPICVALAVAFAAYLMKYAFATTSSAHRAAEENRSPRTWHPSPTSPLAARARQEREWREWCRAQS